MSVGEPTLGGIRPPHERVFAWAGVLGCLALLGPIDVEAHAAIWPPELFGDGHFVWSWGLAILATLLIVVVGGRTRFSRMTKGLAGLALVLVVCAAIMSSRDLAKGVLGLVPIVVHDTAPLFIIAIGAVAAAARYRAGIEGLARNVNVAGILCSIGAVAAVLVYAWPTDHGTVAGVWLESVTAIVSFDVAVDERRAGLTQLILTTLPGGLVLYGSWRSLRAKGTGSSATGWILALTPSVIATLGLKGAATLGDDTHVLLGLRSAILFGGATMTVALSIYAILTQLGDPLGADCHHPTRLVRDQVLYEAMVQSGDRLPNLAEATRHLRPTVRRLVADRFAALLHDIAQEHSHLAPYPVVRDDMLRLMWGDVTRPVTQVAPRSDAPRAARWAHWLAHGRRVELMLGASVALLVCTGSVVRVLDRPTAEPWHLEDDGRWARTLYRDLLPRIAIAAGHEAGTHHELIDAATDDAVAAAERSPELVRALRGLGRAARNIEENHREIVRAGDRVNRAAQDAGIPFYLDVNVLGYRRAGTRYEWVFYVKTYAIDRTRRARIGDATYSALWLERLDRTNVVERQLGWTKRDQPRGMVILDVVRAYWRDDLAPAIAGSARVSPLARIYERHADQIEQDLATAVDRRPHKFPVPPSVLLERLLSCIGRGEDLYGDRPAGDAVDVLAAHKDRPDLARREPVDAYCEETRRQVEPLVLEVLARKVEVHELQHVIDGRNLTPPKQLLEIMRGFDEDSVDFAAAELSAYLAEVVYSDQPRLTLVHFLAVAAQRKWSPEAFAGQVAESLLVDERATLDELIGGPEDRLRTRAREVYTELFKRSLPPIEITTVPITGG